MWLVNTSNFFWVKYAAFTIPEHIELTDLALSYYKYSLTSVLTIKKFFGKLA